MAEMATLEGCQWICGATSGFEPRDIDPRGFAEQIPNGQSIVISEGRRRSYSRRWEIDVGASLWGEEWSLIPCFGTATLAKGAGVAT